MASLFVAAARELINGYRPRCTGFTFEPRRRFGLVIGDLGEPLLNLGAEGVMLIMGIAETFTDRDVEAVLHRSYDQMEFVRWYEGLKNTFDKTTPDTGELRALKGIDERRNVELYRLMGLAAT